MGKTISEIRNERYAKILADSEKFPLKMAANLGRLATEIFETIDLEENSILGKRLIEKVSFLRESEQLVIKKNFGLEENYTIHSLEDISISMSTIYENVREIKEEALKTLRKLNRARDYSTILASLSVRAFNVLQMHDIKTIQQFLNLNATEVLNMKSMGKKSFQSVVNVREKFKKPLEPKYEYEIDSLQLSTRTYHALRRIGVETLQDFLNLTATQVLNIKQIGKKSYDEVVSVRERLNKPLIDKLKSKPKPEDNIDSIWMTQRTYNLLKKNGIRTIQDLLNLEFEEFVKFRNVGRKTLNEVIKIRENLKKPFYNNPF